MRFDDGGAVHYTMRVSAQVSFILVHLCRVRWVFGGAFRAKKTRFEVLGGLAKSPKPSGKPQFLLQRTVAKAQERHTKIGPRSDWKMVTLKA